jgi:hypothetical protein
MFVVGGRSNSWSTGGDRQLIHPRLLKVLMFLGSGEVVT